MSSSRMAALGFVAVLHGAVLAGLLLFKPDFVKKIIAPIEAVQVKEETPPPEEPPPPPPKEQEIPPYVPPPEVTVASDTPPPQITTQATIAQPQPPVFTPPAPPAPPAPAPVGITQGATPVNARIFEVSEDDYPPSSLRAEEEGSTQVTVTIGVNGRVSDCQVTASSNFPKLDERTCNIARSRWRFKPALQAGTPVESKLAKRVKWQILKK